MRSSIWVNPIIYFILLAALFSFQFSCGPSRKNIGPTPELFVAHDFTAENLFTNNIEGPNFDSKGVLYVVNYAKDGTIGKVNNDGNCELFLELPQGSTANAIQFNSKGDMLLADFSGHNVLKVDMKTRAVSALYHDERFNQPNDICVNRRDQIFASDPKWSAGTGQIWRIDPDGKGVILETSMGTTNGIELSPNERILYVNESVQRKIWRYDVDAAGNISNKQLLIEFPDFGMDGMHCDKNGNLYVARWGKGVIAVVSPSGQVLREVALKGKQCSNLVFGGKDKKAVYITLQDRKGMEMFLTDTGGK